MAERYSLTGPAGVLEKRFDVEVGHGYKPQYNAAPTALMPVITNTASTGCSYFYWGLSPIWSKNKSVTPKLYLAEKEKLTQKASFKRAFKSNRCIIPADGYYEWKSLGKKTKVPYRIHQDDELLFAIAGLWEEYEDNGSDDMIHTFRLITVPACKDVSAISDRMPAILRREDENKWLNNKATEEELLALLNPYADEGKLNFYTISHLINNKDYNSPEVIKPAPSVDQHGNLTLFN